MRSAVPVIAALALGLGLVALPAAPGEERPPGSDEQGTTGEIPIEAGVAPGTGVPDPRPGDAFADPEIAELQDSATEVQDELDGLTGQIDSAEQELDAARERLAGAGADREAAEEELAAHQDEIDEFSRAVFTVSARPDDLRVLLTARSAEDVLDGTSMLGFLRGEQDDRLLAALDRHRGAVEAEADAEAAEQEAAELAGELERRTTDAAHRAEAVSAEMDGPLAEASGAVRAAQEAQRERNDETAANWESYLDRLDAAEVSVPSADELADPDALPLGLNPVDGDAAEELAGIAEVTRDGQRLLVLSEETIDAVSAAVDELGKPYVPQDDGEGPVAYSCDGLVHTVFSDNGLELPSDAADQLAEGVTVDYEDAQPGDLAFVGPRRYGVQHVGIVLDSRTMLAADGRIASVAVTDLPPPETTLAIVRPALGQQDPADVPEPAEGELDWRCGGVEIPMSTGADSDHGGAVGAWGGYPNGMIPPAAMCTIGVGAHALRCDAAQAYQAMSAAYAEEFDSRLCVTDSYRSFPAQVDLYQRKPALAAVPGTSNHGWGLAVDLCSGIESFGTEQHEWMRENAPQFGWIHPNWARQGGGREEPWHWEYVGRA